MKLASSSSTCLIPACHFPLPPCSYSKILSPFFLLQPPRASVASTVCFVVAAVELLLCSRVVPAATTWVSCLEHVLDA